MADVLKADSRQFFERTKAKLAISIVVGASSLMLLGFGAYSAGQAASYNTMVRSCGSFPSFVSFAMTLALLTLTNPNLLHCLFPCSITSMRRPKTTTI